MDIFLILALSAVNFIAVFFGVITGGSNLVMTPLLISLGIPAQSAVAATRVGNLGSTPVGLFEFNKSGKVLWRVGLPLVIATVSAAYLGTGIVLSINEILLQRLIGSMILGILFIMILNRRFGLEERSGDGKVSKAIGFFLYFFAILIGSIVGGGAGVLASYILIFFFGLTFLQSSGTRKITGLAGTLVASTVFILAGVVPYEITIPLIVSGSVGAWAGSRYGIRKGEEWARLLFFAVILALGLKMLVF